MTRFEEICNELHNAGPSGLRYERSFRTIAAMAKAEEGCSLAQAKGAVASWWDSAKTILTETSIPHTCLAAFPLHALKVAFLKQVD